jgi:hypothetical protein
MAGRTDLVLRNFINHKLWHDEEWFHSMTLTLQSRSAHSGYEQRECIFVDISMHIFRLSKYFSPFLCRENRSAIFHPASLWALLNTLHCIFFSFIKFNILCFRTLQFLFLFLLFTFFILFSGKHYAKSSYFKRWGHTHWNSTTKYSV